MKSKLFSDFSGMFARVAFDSSLGIALLFTGGDLLASDVPPQQTPECNLWYPHVHDKSPQFNYSDSPETTCAKIEKIFSHIAEGRGAEYQSRYEIAIIGYGGDDNGNIETSALIVVRDRETHLIVMDEVHVKTLNEYERAIGFDDAQTVRDCIRVFEEEIYFSAIAEHPIALWRL